MISKILSLLGALILFVSGCQDNNSREPLSTSVDGVFGTRSTHTTGKDLTLLYGDTRLQTDSLPERIRRLKFEITKGEGVYTPDELKVLERKLADYENQYRVIQHP